MPKNNTEQVLIEFRLGQEASAGVRETLEDLGRELTPAWSDGLQESLRQLVMTLEQVRGTGEAQVEATTENTAAVIQNTVAQATGGQSVLSSAGRTVAKVFTSGFGLSPLISGLVGLFTGGSNKVAVQEATPYVWPASIHFEGAVSRTGKTPGQEWPQSDGLRHKGEWGGEFQGRPLNITFQVQALDSRSFLEHSDEIARAVREAMLNSHALNDVVSEL